MEWMTKICVIAATPAPSQGIYPKEVIQTRPANLHKDTTAILIWMGEGLHSRQWSRKFWNSFLENNLRCEDHMETQKKTWLGKENTKFY